MSKLGSFLRQFPTYYFLFSRFKSQIKMLLRISNWKWAITSEIRAKPNELITVLWNSFTHSDRDISSANTNMLE